MITEGKVSNITIIQGEVDLIVNYCAVRNPA